MGQNFSAGFLDRRTAPHIATLILMAGLSALAMNIFLPSLPGMTAYFQTDYRLMQLSVALYLGVNAVLQLIVGPISDRWGRRPVVLWGIALFLLATLGCVLSGNIYVFLTFRMMQATIVVAMVLSRAIVRDMVPEAQAASMIGYVTMGMAVVPMIGPAIGGVLDQAFGWQAGFWLVFGLGGAGVHTDLGRPGRNRPRHRPDLSRTGRETIPFSSARRVSGAIHWPRACASGSFFAYLGGAPFVGDRVFGLEPAALGIYFGAPALGYILGNFLSGRFAARVGVNRMVLWGTLVNAAGIALNLAMFYAGLSNAVTFFGLMSFVGLGNGLTNPSAAAGALSVRPQLAGVASGLSGALLIGGGAALSALAGAMLTPQTGAFPLLWIMLGTALLAIVAIVLVMRRERRLALG